MSGMDEKLARAERGLSSIFPRQLFRKHLHFKDETPRWFESEEDGGEVPRVLRVRAMDKVQTWFRVTKADGDWWFEMRPESYEAPVEAPEATDNVQVPGFERVEVDGGEWGGKSTGARHVKRRRKAK